MNDEESPRDDDAEPEATPAVSAKWLRVRRSRLINIDKINQITVQQRNGDVFLEIRADQKLHIPVPDLEHAWRALEALTRGEMDISQFTVGRNFGEAGGEG